MPSKSNTVSINENCGLFMHLVAGLTLRAIFLVIIFQI